MKSYFVTATDTDAGKTEVTTLLLKAFAMKGLQSVAMKPISAGCELRADAENRNDDNQAEEFWLCNSDALALQTSATVQLPYAWVNPFAYEPAIAPHIAAELNSNNKVPTVAGLQQAYAKLTALTANVLLCEGAGGWQLPINQQEYLADFVVAANMPVILVVSMRLGCINHALLTAQAIAASGLPIAGWVANQTSAEQMPFYRENVASIQQRINAPLLAEVPYFAGKAGTDAALNNSTAKEQAKEQWLREHLAKPQNMLRTLGF